MVSPSIIGEFAVHGPLSTLREVRSSLKAAE